jgi:nucleoside-diphosphate-sugar epimerase
MQVKDGRVVPNFIDQALHNKPLTIYGDGKQTRSFCYYSDLIDGIIRLLYSGLHEPINIGNPREFTIFEFANLILKFSGAKVKIVYHPLPVDDPKQRQPDITLAKKYLKWEPKVDLEDGLKETLDWFKIHKFANEQK